MLFASPNPVAGSLDCIRAIVWHPSACINFALLSRMCKHKMPVNLLTLNSCEVAGSPLGAGAVPRLLWRWHGIGLRGHNGTRKRWPAVTGRWSDVGAALRVTFGSRGRPPLAVDLARNWSAWA